MDRLLRHVRLGCVVLALALTGTVAGQDLGSSNKLFGNPSTSAPKKAVKKTTAKPKAVAAKPKTTTKKTITASKTSKPLTTQAKQPANTAVKKTEKPAATQSTATNKSIAPEPGQPAVAAGPAADRLFEELIQKGNAARDERNYSNADAAYRRARAVKPSDPRAVYGLGNLFSDQQRWEDAESAYRAALELEPGSAIAYIALSYVLTQPISVSNLADRYEEAEQMARRAIQLAPSNSLAFDQLGVALELRGLIGAETENAYRRATQIDPTFAPAYAHLGRLLRRRGLTKESAAAYQEAIRLSTDVATMILVADVMQSEQRFAESEPLLRKAINDDPRNPSALLLLGRALTTLGNYTDAERVLRTSLEVSPNGFVAYSLLGSLYIRQGKFELAENALLQALRYVTTLEKRRLSQQFEVVGDGYMKIGKARNAERSYRQGGILDPENESLANKLVRAQRG